MDEYIGQIFKQNCGDYLKILSKTDLKKRGRLLYKAIFIKYPYETLDILSSIKLGKVNNPQIEIEEFVNKIWPQKCGGSIKILEKSDKKQNNTYLWKCHFVGDNNILFCKKDAIIKGQVTKQEEFIGKEFKQNCGDILIIKKEFNKRIDSLGKSHIIYECGFLKYPCIVYAEKQNIIKGSVNNPQIEIEEFIGKQFKQNCGDFLKVLSKTSKQSKTKGNFLFECEFLNKKYPYKCLSNKSEILLGQVDNLALPWKTKEGLSLFIDENFNKNPTLQELSEKINISISHLSNILCKFGLQNKIKYYPTESNLENEIREYIQFLLGRKISNSWNELDGKEIDIYISNLRVGFEFNGNYWHCELYKGIKSHQEKSLLAKEKNIQLIHIFEYEWLLKKEQIKGLIKSKLGIFNKKIGASKCKIKELNNKIYQEFCNNNHIQGECGAKVKLGLFYKEELVQVMSFGSPRFTDKYEWEIIRECSKIDTIILGGKDKLWKYFLKHYTPKNCISYCDFSKFSGDSYERLGFKKERLNQPGFIWWDKKTNIVYFRTPWKNEEYKKKFLKIYDCGQLVFIWEP